jgi:mannose-6-phosphate isomerase-like protein (cupin superfamily)
LEAIEEVYYVIKGAGTFSINNEKAVLKQMMLFMENWEKK